MLLGSNRSDATTQLQQEQKLSHGHVPVMGSFVSVNKHCTKIKENVSLKVSLSSAVDCKGMSLQPELHAE